MMLRIFSRIIHALCFVCLILSGCTSSGGPPNLVPEDPATAQNYWCTWYWQNYNILKGQPVTTPDPRTVYTNPAARDELTEEILFGKDGWARALLPRTRGDYFFLIDHGWQDKSIKENTFFTFIMDTIDFPSYAKFEPKERIKRLNDDIKELGWRGLGLWVRGNISSEDARKFVEWSKYAGIKYWKIDGGDTDEYFSYRRKQEIFPELALEYVTGAAGPINQNWEIEGEEVYPSVYTPETDLIKSPALSKADKALEVLKNSDVFRTYDAAPLLVSTVTLQRIHDILRQTAGHSEYVSTLNIQDDCNIAAALGCLVAVKRHPMETPRMYEGRDYHLQIAGDRHVDKRLNEMDRLARWQRIAPPMPAGYGTYHASERMLIDKFVFRKSDTWFSLTHGKMVSQSAPAVMARNISLPEVGSDGEPPYVLASRFPNGAVCIATEGRVRPDDSWYHPRADIAVECGDGKGSIGVFGYYKSLSLKFDRELSGSTVVWAQDLLSGQAMDISGLVKIEKNVMHIPGDLIEEIGTSENDEGDISAPGLVIKLNNF